MTPEARPEGAPPTSAIEPEAQTEGMDPSRIGPGEVKDLRGRTARGTLLNSGYQVGLTGLGLVQRLVVAAFLTRADFGLWSVILTILVNLGWLKDLGIGDKYIQQSDDDQELAFQQAFTLELYSSIAFFFLFVLLLPLWALAYGHPQLILPGVIAAVAAPLNAFQMPSLIPYRRMEYGRQRRLTSVAAVVSFVVTVGTAIAGAGYWCFIIGALTGSIAGGIVCTVTSPYRLRLRADRQIARSYLSFSWPLVAAGLSRLVLVQGSLLVANYTVGLSGVGVIGIVIAVVSFADRVDGLVSQTIYPAICAVAHRMQLLEEVFLKSNRVALMWAVPFATGLALFAADLITYVLGEKWRPAEGLLVVIALSVGINQVAFNWMMFHRALNKTRPILVASVFGLVVFLGLVIPGMFAWGLAGYGVAFVGSTLVQIAVRTYYMRELFHDFAVLRHSLRALAPTVPPAALVLLIRLLAGGDRTLARAIGELAVYIAGSVLCTVLLERALVTELFGYFRRGASRGASSATVAG